MCDASIIAANQTDPHLSRIGFANVQKPGILGHDSQDNGQRLEAQHDCNLRRVRLYDLWVCAHHP